MAESRLRGSAVALAVTLVLVALDSAFGRDVTLSGAYMLGAFVAAVLADIEVTLGVAAVAVALSLASPLWNHNFGEADYFIKIAINGFGSVFAVETARLRQQAQRNLYEQSLLAAVAELPAPGASLAQTVERVTELIIPRMGSFAAIDALRGDELVPVGRRGEQPADERVRLATPLRARGRQIGALTVAGRSYDERDRSFLRVLAGRIALALDNAGLSQELETVEEQLNAILANLAEAVTVQDRTGRLVFANQAAADLLDAPSVDALLATDTRELVERFETFNEDGTPLRIDQLPGRHVLAGREPEPLVVRAVNRVTGEERWRVTKSTPILGPDGEVVLAVNVIEDVTEAKRSELGQRLLSEASVLLAASLDYESTLQSIAELAVPALADWCSVSVPRSGGLALVAVAPEGTAARDLHEGAAEVLRGGRSLLVPEQSLALVPMATPERTSGVIAMVRDDSGRRFSPGDLALAEELGRRAGTALENARLHTELADIAHTLQQGLLPPTLPDVPGWSFRSLYMPASGEAEVGGDFYDVFPTAAGWMAVIGDVAGRGPAAASLTSMARYTLRTAGTLVGTPTMALARLNENLRERGELALCTAAIVLLREESEASIVSAGHPLPLLVRGGEPQPVGRTGPLLGAFDHGHWLPELVSLEPGDVLVLFTDGVIDARAGDGAGRFGEERLAETLAGASDSEDAIRRIHAALAQFSGGEHADDTAVLALQRV